MNGRPNLRHEFRLTAPTKSLGQRKQLGSVATEPTAQRRAQEAPGSHDPGNRHRRAAGRVGFVPTTYNGLPITMFIVSDRYSAITPSAVRTTPEKKATTITSDAHPGTCT